VDGKFVAWGETLKKDETDKPKVTSPELGKKLTITIGDTI